MLLVVGILLLCGIDYAEYRISAQWLTLLLGRPPWPGRAAVP